MAATSSNPFAERLETLAALLPGHSLPWLDQLRARAQEMFRTHGFPSPREEEWRYTNVSAIEKKLFSLGHDTSAALTVTAADILPFLIEDAWSLIVVDGRFVPELSKTDGMPDTVVVTGMADALQIRPDFIKQYFEQAVSFQEHGFVAFNTACFADGVLIEVPAKLKLDKPVQLLNFISQPDCMKASRNLIVIGEQSEAQVIETFAGFDNAYLSATVSEVFVEKNAELSLYKLQCESEKSYHFGGTYVKVARDGRFRHHNFAFGSLLARSDIHADLGYGSDCELNGLYLGRKRQHLDNHTRINHGKPHATSRETYKGVLDEKSRGVFQGRVVVAENAQKTDSVMSNRNLLLSDDAEADTKPQLEIYADDVKCGHGVTVGQLEEKSVFYLQSRGVDEDVARNMLTFAFANEMVDKITIRELHDRVLEQVLLRFPQEGVNKAWL